MAAGFRVWLSRSVVMPFAGFETISVGVPCASRRALASNTLPSAVMTVLPLFTCPSAAPSRYPGYRDGRN